MTNRERAEWFCRVNGLTRLSAHILEAELNDATAQARREEREECAKVARFLTGVTVPCESERVRMFDGLIEAVEGNAVRAQAALRGEEEAK